MDWIDIVKRLAPFRISNVTNESKVVEMDIDMKSNENKLGELLISKLDKRYVEEQVNKYRIVENTGSDPLTLLYFKKSLAHQFKLLYPSVAREAFWISKGLSCRRTPDHTLLYRFANRSEFTPIDMRHGLLFGNLIYYGMAPITFKEMYRMIPEHINDELYITPCLYHLRGENVNTTLGYYIGTEEGVGSGISAWNRFDNDTEHFKAMYSRYKIRHTRDISAQRELIVIKVTKDFDFIGSVDLQQTKAEYIDFGPERYKFKEEGQYTDDKYNIRYKPNVIQYFEGGSYIFPVPNAKEIDLVGNVDIKALRVTLPTNINLNVISCLLETIQDNNCFF